mgnify:CR=1 FL=1
MAKRIVFLPTLASESLLFREVLVDFDWVPGIAISQAEWWCFILSGKMEDKIIIIIELEKLKDICRIEFIANNIKEMGDNNTSKAVLIPIKKLNTY